MLPWCPAIADMVLTRTQTKQPKNKGRGRRSSVVKVGNRDLRATAKTRKVVSDSDDETLESK
jgi:hypothetical protein